MRQSFTQSLLLAGAMLASTARLAAQTPEARNPATDTLQPENASYRVPVSQIGTLGGKRLSVFIKDFGLDYVLFTWRHPLTLPRPKPVRMTTAQLNWLRTEGVLYEPVRTSLNESGVLAARVSSGPRLALFDVATPKKGVPVPLPGAIIWTGAFSSKYNHAWYVRAPGETLMRAVPKGCDFAPFAAALLADAPELATAIQAKTKGYEHDDLPQLLERYNKAAPAAR